MPILVKLSTSLRALAPGYDPLTGLSVEAEQGRSVARLLARLGIPPEKVKIIMVNGVAAGADTVLADGDRVGLFPPVGGG
ncbi:MAG: MoaD/ThiS family protein [Proteobacteria bacterium]|nr:MoaD/ThiS family protein [Pseudomonadota bacterium]MBU1741134.1 MoaD/ThiS family protein [Pseudomonadota bacterium]